MSKIKLYNDEFFGKQDFLGQVGTKKERQYKKSREKKVIPRLLDRIEAGLPVNQIPPSSGLAQEGGPEPRIQLIPAGSQYLIQHRNSSIVFAKDRPSHRVSGYGRSGLLNADAIDIVVGRMSSLPKVNTRKKTTFVNPHFGADAARIYISQMTDIDHNFGIVEGFTGQPRGRSGIGIKADVVRLVGREGIKIVTGKADFPGFGKNGETNSRGGKIRQPAPKIELIAGNSMEVRKVRGGLFRKKEVIEFLQPVVQGDNLVTSLRELAYYIEKLFGMVYNMGLIQTATVSSLGIDLWPLNSAHKGATGGASAAQTLSYIVSTSHQARIDASLWGENYTNPAGYRYICSRNVFST